MLLIKCGDEEVRYYSLSEASSKIIKNQWDVPVDGIHSETLRRAHRDSPKVGKRIGRDVFFSTQDIKLLGYEIDERSTHTEETIQLFPLETN